ILHDETLFPQPDQFRPERFLDNSRSEPTLSGSRLNPRELMFGVGRRICLGFRVADATLFLAITCMLATLDFGRAEGDEGELDVGYASGLVA
ncbi:hypothetical protein FRC10_000897, partial [Ceratobasidium sp. 414]